ncbi:MAG: hypothetical protein WBA16_08585 [Nonlabens sp.]
MNTNRKVLFILSGLLWLSISSVAQDAFLKDEGDRLCKEMASSTIPKEQWDVRTVSNMRAVQGQGLEAAQRGMKHRRKTISRYNNINSNADYEGYYNNQVLQSCPSYIDLLIYGDPVYRRQSNLSKLYRRALEFSYYLQSSDLLYDIEPFFTTDSWERCKKDLELVHKSARENRWNSILNCNMKKAGDSIAIIELKNINDRDQILNLQIKVNPTTMLINQMRIGQGISSDPGQVVDDPVEEISDSYRKQ